jgi:hypothetical protein
VAGRCERPAGCPLITIDGAQPLGAEGKLLASVVIPEDVPGTGKIKVGVTGRIGTLEPTDAPKRRCRSGEKVARGRSDATVGTANVLIQLTKLGARCLAADPDGRLPVDVEVLVKRRKTRLAAVAEHHAWQR